MKRLIAIALLCMVVLSGCTQSNIVSPDATEDGKPDTEIKEGISIDWNQVWDDMREELITPESKFEKYIVDLKPEFNKDKNLVTLNLYVMPDMPEDAAIEYAEEALKECGDSIATQDFNYKGTDSSTYGTYFDDHDVRVRVVPYNTDEDDSTCIIDDTVKAGEQRGLIAKETQ